MESRVLGVLLIAAAALCARAEREHAHHGGGGDDHSAHGHTPDLDHQTVLGSRKTAHEFDALGADESKRRLRALARKMDANGDGRIDKAELQAWIYRALLQLDQEETAERFEEIDKDKNNEVTWAEYLSESFGTEDTKELDAEYAKLMDEDRAYFAAADVNGDGVLSMEEFNAFQNPEHAPHMHATLVKNTLREKDTNGDGKIELREFLGDIHEQPQSEFYATEKNRFNEEYDKDKDGYLEGEELRAWLIPDFNQTALDEAEHLISSADENKDGELTLDEVVANHTVFVGSEATNFGEQLNAIRHEEL